MGVSTWFWYVARFCGIQIASLDSQFTQNLAKPKRSVYDFY
ncbi:hypothetical protein [Helicobacter sp. T3_23-1056]